MKVRTTSSARESTTRSAAARSVAGCVQVTANRAHAGGLRGFDARESVFDNDRVLWRDAEAVRGEEKPSGSGLPLEVSSAVTDAWEQPATARASSIMSRFGR